jgi:hypothetical protein
MIDKHLFDFQRENQSNLQTANEVIPQWYLKQVLCVLRSIAVEGSPSRELSTAHVFRE